ncbi:MAG: 6-carboxytetrahydropterin synthase QueD [Rhodospirillales bacterium]|nr:6-carboxytetrahydropterin synthase QueD [Rhodospirillales bacterium]
MFTISKTFDFSASHILDGLPEGHQCGRLHGHNYKVEVVLEGMALDERGFVMDYGDLAPFKAYLDDTFDHRHLNDLPAFHGVNPTAENMARHLHDWCRAEGWPVARVGVSETPKTWAWYE